MSIDWGEGIKIAVGGYGITILVLLILAILGYVLAFIVKKASDRQNKGGDDKEKGKL
jgi:Na+-transporting methylmalonyl-CoA/oxaloacetate decarboxylase gamma subunit